jgi:predicted GIY-YIG superfamily endonuclease
LSNRAYYTYLFKRGNQVLHGGMTTDLERREKDHQQNIDPKGHIFLVGRRKTEDGARRWERENGWE